jgi:hypothetical protein
MSKNKNPLKDLDLFLKQQASSFVSPTPVSEKIQVEPSSPASQTVSSPDVTQEDLIQTLNNMMDKNPSALYDLLIKAAEQKSGGDRTILINTALYLKNTDNWKDAIREYWKNSGFKA